MPADLQAYLDQQEREILVKTLRETNFNRTAAAQRLGLSLRQIRYRIARLARMEGDAVQHDFTGMSRLGAEQDIQEPALARAERASERHDLTLAYIQIDRATVGEEA